MNNNRYEIRLDEATRTLRLYDHGYFATSLSLDYCKNAGQVMTQLWSLAGRPGVGNVALGALLCSLRVLLRNVNEANQYGTHGVFKVDLGAWKGLRESDSPQPPPLPAPTVEAVWPDNVR